MNDFEIKQLISQLQNKYDQKIAELEQEINILKQQLIVKSSKEESATDDILVYYLDKYQTEATNVKERRLSVINSEINDLKDDFQNIQIQLTELENASSDYLIRLESSADLNQELQNIHLELEDLKFEYERKINSYYKDIQYLDDIFNEKLGSYCEVVASFLNEEITIEEINFDLAHLLNYFLNEGYQKASILVDLVNNTENLQNNYVIKNKELNNRINEINNSLEQSKVEDPNLYIDEVKKMLDDINQELVRKNQVYNSLVDLIDSLILNHLENIKDTYRYHKLVDTSKQEISSILENQISSLLTKLLNSDTDANRKNNLLLRLSELEQEISDLEVYVSRKTELELEYKEYEKALEVVTENANKMRQYVEKSYQLIKSNQQYHYFFDEYISANTKIKELNSIIDLLKQENSVLREKRKKLVLDPYAKTKLNELDENIDVNETKISRSLQEIALIKDSISRRGLENEKLFKVIKDKEITENKLKEINNKKDELVHELTRRYEELQEYYEKEHIYRRLIEEANDINEKIKNNNY